MGETSPPTPRELFLYRFAAVVACGVAMLAAAHGAYFAFARVPNTRAMVRDFDQTMPPVSRLAYESPWIPLAAAVVALLTGVAALGAPKPALLVAAYLLSLLAVALVLAAEVAAAWPLDRILRSLNE